VSETVDGSFGVLLREKLAELDADETTTPLVIDNDPVERLRLDARQAVRADRGGPMPRSGHQAYVAAPPPPVELGQRHLDIVY
jgi:hypothetical protein